MLRLRNYGIDTDYLEIERIYPKKLCALLRKKILTMHYAHLPLFLLFYKFDLIFTSTAYGALILRALLKTLYIKVPKWVILDFNILGTIGDCKQLRQRIFSWAVSKVDGIVAISQAESDALKVKFPHLRDKIIFLHEATDIDYFSPSNEPEENYIISVGNYGRDFKTVVEAVKGMNIELKLATKLIKKNDSTLPKNVNAGLYSHSEMMDLYKRSKAVVIGLDVNEKYFDSVGTLSIGEAFAMGKTTIVSHTKSMESYVEDGENALFVKLKDVDSMRNAIKKVIDDNNLRLRIGKNARDYAVKYLDPEIFASKLADFLKTI
jgi:glycosyltransferase involved in cell wall biosynthesis